MLSNEISCRLKELILSKQKEYEYNVLDIEVMPDHIHLILSTNPKTGIYRVVSKIKGKVKLVFERFGFVMEEKYEK